jgi:glycosyltransferase involved in cell wall biosynthesis
LFTEHGRFYPDLASTKRRWFNRVMTSRRDRLVAVGDAVRQALIKNEGLPGERIEIIYNGVRTSPVQLTDVQRSALRRELGVGDEEFVVIQVARLDSIKDHSTALKAVCLAAGQYPALCLALVGDGPEREHIEQLIAELGLQHRVQMLGQRRDVPDLLAAADAFLLSSLSEGIPVTIIEAMAAGLPVASTKVGGVPEVIDDEVTGLLAPAGDAAKLAAAIVRLATDETLRTKLAANGKKRAENRFSEAEMVQRYDCIYAEMIGEATGTRASLETLANGHEGPAHRGSASELLA